MKHTELKKYILNGTLTPAEIKRSEELRESKN